MSRILRMSLKSHCLRVLVLISTIKVLFIFFLSLIFSCCAALAQLFLALFILSLNYIIYYVQLYDFFRPIS